MSKPKQQPQAPKPAVAEEQLISHWDGNKFVKINNAKLFQLCIDDGQSLLMDKSAYELEKKELDALRSKHKMWMESTGKNQVRFTTRLRTTVDRIGCDLVLALHSWQ
jgi:hypothetical protein